MKKIFTIDNSCTGQRIDAYLTNELNLPRTQVQKLIKEGLVTIGYRPSTIDYRPKPSYLLKGNEVITVTLPEPQPDKARPQDLPLNIIYEDSDILVLNKPRGMCVHPGAGRMEGTLVNALLWHCRDLSGIGGILRPGIVHRLDKDTSGVMLVAKNDAAHQNLMQQFAGRKVNKIYLALVHGNFPASGYTVEGAIGRSSKNRLKMEINTKGRSALTEIYLEQAFDRFSLLKIHPHTGRTHQIRVHLTALNFPIVGDPLYGKKAHPFAIKGQALHAYKLGFCHPKTGEYLEFTAPLPEDIEEIINRIQKT
jgi:23S rRNA pseudouridine1911/1915/1917 synthase